MLQEHGIAHGDPFGHNIIVSEDDCRLIDFSHPKYREQMGCEQLWTAATERDSRILEMVFREMSVVSDIRV